MPPAVFISLFERKLKQRGLGKTSSSAIEGFCLMYVRRGEVMVNPHVLHGSFESHVCF
jgi:hypothetical protein